MTGQLPNPLPGELSAELSQHARALRGLARALLRDHHAAEDVAQQTMHQALAVRQRLSPGPLGGWLQRTLRNFAKQWRRGERRRTAREDAFAAATGLTAGAAQGPAEALARRESLQAVTDAVLQLDEPFQTAIFLRYFEDLPPRAIARRTGASIATVKSRLARGLVMLRQRLATTRDRDWRAALALTFGLPLGATLIPLTVGALLVNTTLKIAVAAIVLVGVGAFWLDQRSVAPTPQTQSDATTRGDATSAQANVDKQPEQPTVERMAIEASADEGAWLEHPFQLELAVLVLDSTGLPIAGHRPEFAPVDGALRDCDVETDAAGRAIVRWSSRTPRAEIELLDTRRHRRRIALQHGQTTRAVLVRDPSTAGPTLTFGTFLTREVLMAGQPLQLGNARRSDAMALGLHPFAVFSEKGIVVDNPDEPQQAPENVSFNFRSLVSAGTFELKLGKGGNLIIGESEIVDTILTAAKPPEEPANARVEGIVYGEQGEPARSVAVVLLGAGPQPLQRGQSDEHGNFHFDDVLAGDVTVRAGGDREGLGTSMLRVDGGTWRTTVQLHRAAVVQGVVRGPDNQPKSGVTVEWHADDGTWADRTTTDDNGTFVLANLPPGTGQLLVWLVRGGADFPTLMLPSVFANPGPLAITLPPEQHNGVRLVVQSPDDLPGEHAPRVRVRQVATGFSRTMKSPDDSDPSWRLSDLPSGDYEIAIWMAGAGAVSLGRQWLGDDTMQDLGTIKLPRAGRAVFVLPAETPLPAGLDAEIVQLRADFDVRYEVLGGFDAAILMPAGDYALITKIEGRTVHTHKFRLTAGTTTEVPVTW